MSSGKDKQDEGLSEVPGLHCRLSSLQKRSQIDFEIDFYERILSRDPNYLEVLARLGELFARKGWHRRALQVDQRLAQLRPEDPNVAYNLACSYAVLNCVPEAIDSLRRAVNAGYDDLDHLSLDPDLASLRTNPDFIRLIQAIEDSMSTRIV
jgi:tetratricopeptide (TPR) repeat protein